MIHLSLVYVQSLPFGKTDHRIRIVRKMEENLKRKDKDTPDEEYSFIKETVKDVPVDPKKRRLYVLKLVVSALVFGLIAGLTCSAVFNMRMRQAVSAVTIPDDEEYYEDMSQDSAESDMTESDDSEEESPTEEILTEEEKTELAVEDLERFNRAVKAVADEVRTSMVTVSGYEGAEAYADGIDEAVTSRSGIIIADNGQNLLILTEQDAAFEAATIMVTFVNNTAVEGSLVSRDPVTGLCVVQVSLQAVPDSVLHAVSIAQLGTSYGTTTGTTVVAVGSPCGTERAFEVGRVAAMSRKVVVTDGAYTMIDTDIAGTETGSGVLINMKGQVLGVIAQKYVQKGSDCISVIPISPIKNLLERLSNNEKLCYLGIRGQDVSTVMTEVTGVPTGVYVVKAFDDSPAQQAGIQPGDVITAIDDSTVTSLAVLGQRLVTKQPGDAIVMTVQRFGAGEYVEVTLPMTVGTRE